MGRNNVGTWLRGHRMVSVVLLTVLSLLGGTVATAAPSAAAATPTVKASTSATPRAGELLPINVSSTGVLNPIYQVDHARSSGDVMIFRGVSSNGVIQVPLDLVPEGPAHLIVSVSNRLDDEAPGASVDLFISKAKIVSSVVLEQPLTRVWPQPIRLLVQPDKPTSLKASGTIRFPDSLGMPVTRPVVDGVAEFIYGGPGSFDVNMVSYSGDDNWTSQGAAFLGTAVRTPAVTKAEVILPGSSTVAGRRFMVGMTAVATEPGTPQPTSAAAVLKASNGSVVETAWTGRIAPTGSTVDLADFTKTHTGTWNFQLTTSSFAPVSYLGATSPAVRVTIAPANGTVTILSADSAGPATVGGAKYPVTANVLVNDNRAPNGNVTFTSDDEQVATVPVAGNATTGWTATARMPVDALGQHDVQATYESVDQLTSTDALSFEVVKAQSTVQAPQDRSLPVNSEVTVLVAAPKTGIRPTGKVRLYDGPLEVDVRDLSRGDGGVDSAAFDLASLGMGAHDLRFVYDGTAEIAGSEAASHLVLTEPTQRVTTTLEMLDVPVVDPASPLKLGVTMHVADNSEPAGPVELWIDGAKVDTKPAARTLSFDLPADQTKTYSVLVKALGGGLQRPSQQTLTYTVPKAETATKATAAPGGVVTSDDAIAVTVEAQRSKTALLEKVKVHLLGSTDLLGEVKLTDGSGSYRPTGLTPGFYILVFDYPGDAKTAPSSSTLFVKVADPTETTLTIDRPSIVVGSGLVATATAIVKDRAGNAVSGDVAFTVGDGEQKVKELDANGVATLALPADKVGSLPVLARFVGNETQGASRQTKPYDVVKAATAVSVAFPPNATAADKITVTVAATGTSLKPSGLVRVTGRGVPKAVTLNDQGVGEMLLAGWAEGSYDLEFEYRGDANMEVSSKAVTVKVVKTATSMSLTPTAPQATVRGTDLVTMKATVRDAAGNPVEGVVDFTVGDGQPEAVDLTDGVAELELPAGEVGTYDVVVDFWGDDFMTAAHATETYRVVKAETELDVDVPVKATTSDVATVTVQSTDSSVVPEGPVHVTGPGYDDDIDLTGGVGSIGLDRLSPGSHQLVFDYQGDDNTKSSASVPVTVKMAGAVDETKTAVTFSRQGPIVGTERFTATATVTVGGEPVDSGQVDFLLDGEQLETFDVPADGTVDIELPLDKAGEHDLTAHFTGTEALTSSDDTQTYEVVPAPTEMTLDIPDEPTTSDEVIITLSSAASGSSVVPSGHVTVFEGDFSRTFDLIDGRTALPLELLEPGEHGLMFSYDGDGRAGSVNRFRTIVVGSAGGEHATTTTLSLDGEEAVVGAAPITATVTVTGALSLEGTVSLAVDGSVVDSWDATDGPVDVALPVDVVKEEHVVLARFEPTDRTRQEASTSLSRSYSVVKADTEVTAEASQDESEDGAALVTVKVVATNSSVIPAGGATITARGRGATRTVPLNAQGEGELRLTGMPVGRYDVDVHYEGDGKTNGSETGTELVILEPGAPTTQTLLELNETDPIVGSDTFELTATVKAGGEVVMTGNLAIYVDGELYTSLLVDGPVTHALPVDGIGNHDVTAKYTGWFTHKPSSAMASYNVVRATSTVSLDVPAEASAASIGRITVDANGSSQVPTGRVRVTTEGFSKIVRLEEVTGRADLPLAGLSVGSHVLELDYEGDVFVNGTQSTATVDIARVPTHVELDLDEGQPQAQGKDPYVVEATVTADDKSAPHGDLAISVDGAMLKTVSVDGAPVKVELPIDAIGEKEVVAAYAGNDRLASSTGTTSYRVVRATSTMSLDIPAGPTQADEVVISIAAPRSNAVPSGTVHVSGAGVDRTLPATQGVATYPLEDLMPGAHELTFTYSGDDLVAGVAETATIDVAADTRGTTTTALEVSSAYVGDVQPATATVTVLDSAGEPVTGSVTFTGVGEPRTVTLTGGVAKWTLPNDTAGRHVLTARFAGDATLKPSQGTSDYVVLRAPTELTAEVEELVYSSDAVKLTVTAQESSAKPTGDVHVTIDGDNRIVEMTDGVGELALEDLEIGTYELSFEYVGDDSTAPTSAYAYFEIVDAGSLTRAQVELDRPSTVVGGAKVKATAHISMDDGNVPVGRAELWLDTRHIQSAQVNGESVTFDLPADVVKADRKVWVRFLPADAWRHPSSFSQATYSVVKADAEVSVVVPDGATAGDVVDVSVSATNSSVVPSGRVHVTGSGVNEWVALDASGVGELALAGFAPGTYGLSFAYEGDGKVNGSSAGPVSVTVVKASSSMTLSPQDAEATVGGSDLVTLEATVLDAAGKPRAGDVVFSGVGEPVPVGLDAEGVAELVLPATKVGAYTVTAEFAGDGAVGSARATASYRVVAAESQVEVEVPAKATVADVAAVSVSAKKSTLVPAGTVHVTGSGVDETFDLDAQGAGELPLAGLAVGSYALTFAYSGDEVAGINGSSKVVEFEVVATATHTVLELSGQGRAAVGGADLVTATATVVDADEVSVAGRVVFTGVGEPKTVTLVDGVAQWTLPAEKVDEYALVATFEGDGDLASSRDSAAYSVVKADTKTSVVVPDEPTAADVVEVRVEATNSTVVPSGDVVVTGAGATEKRVHLDATSAGELPLAGLAPGTYQLTFAYEGDENTDVSSTDPVTVVVPVGPGEPVVTSMSLEVVPRQVVFGDGRVPVATARVLDANEQPAEGDVAFTVGEVSKTVGLVDGVAELDLPSGAVDEFTVSAAFTGAGYVESHQSTTYAVVKAGTSTSVTVPGEPGGLVGSGESLKVTVGATNSAVVPAGPVRVTGEGVEETVSLDEVVDGKAVGELPLTGLAPGKHELTFAYEGDGFTHESLAEPVTVIVRQTKGTGETGTSLTVTPQEPQYGGAQVSVSASVTVTEGEVAGGQVAFKVGSWFSLVPVEEGVATLKLDADKLGPVEVVAYYLGTKTLNSSVSDPVSFTVVKAHTATSVPEPSGPVVAGEVVPVSVESTGSAVVPTGRVHVTGGGVDAWVNLAEAGSGEGGEHGRAEGSFELPELEPGSYELTFAYEGDGFTNESSAEPVTVIVRQTKGTGETGTSLTVTPQEPQYGGPQVSVSASVSVPEGAVAEGQVAFKVGSWFRLVPVRESVATLKLDADKLGAVEVTAYYLGTGTLNSSVSDPVSYEVVKAETAITVTDPAGPVAAGDMVPVSVESTGSAVVPTGRVHVTGGDIDAWVPLSAASGAGAERGRAKGAFELPELAPGSYELTFAYEGDGFTKESSAELVPVVVEDPSGTTASRTELTVTPTAVPIWAPKVRATAVVTAAGRTPTGFVVFRYGEWYKLVRLGDDGTAGIDLDTDVIGTVAVKAYYLGDGTTKPSASEFVRYDVTKIPTSITVDGASGDLVPGASLPVTVSASGSDRVPAGKVSVHEGAKELDALKLVGGKATLSLAGLTVGSHTLDLAYAGDGNVAPSNVQVTVVIKPLATTTSLVLDVPTTTANGAAVTATAGVKVARDVVPSGSLKFEVDGVVVATQPAGSAPVKVALPIDKVGVHKVLVRYAGGPTESDSVSAESTYEVTKAASTLSAKLKKLKGRKFKVTATVTSPMPVTGTVQVMARQGKKGKLKAVGAAVVKKVGTTVQLVITTKALTKGKRPLTIRYLGSTSVLAASKTYTVRVR